LFYYAARAQGKNEKMPRVRTLHSCVGGTSAVANSNGFCLVAKVTVEGFGAHY